MCGRCLKEGCSFIDERLLRRLAAKKKSTALNVAANPSKNDENTANPSSTTGATVALIDNSSLVLLRNHTQSHTQMDLEFCEAVSAHKMIELQSDESMKCTDIEDPHDETRDSELLPLPIIHGHFPILKVVIRCKTQRNRMPMCLRGLSIYSVFLVDILNANILWMRR